MSTTKVIFNIPTPVKRAAAKRAKQDGLTLTEFLNAATRAYVRGEVELPHPELRATPRAVARFRKIREEVRMRKNLSPAFTDVEDALRWLKR